MDGVILLDILGIFANARILDDCTVDASLWDYHIMKQVITKSTKLPAN